MKVVLMEDVAQLGGAGDVKEVADGYARNFLLPRGLAAAATPEAIQRAQAKAQSQLRQQQKLDDEASALAAKLAGLKVQISARVGAQGRLFGSVTSSDIAQHITDAMGRAIDRHQIELEEPLRTLGTYEVPVRLSRNVRATLKVEVVAEE